MIVAWNTSISTVWRRPGQSTNLNKFFYQSIWINFRCNLIVQRFYPRLRDRYLQEKEDIIVSIDKGSALVEVLSILKNPNEFFIEISILISNKKILILVQKNSKFDIFAFNYKDIDIDLFFKSKIDVFDFEFYKEMYWCSVP